jgi:uncharacterized integral membrane protein
MTYQPGIEPPNQPGIHPPPAPAYPPTGAANPADLGPATRSAQQAAPTEPAPAGLTSQGRVRPTRVSALWIGFIVAALLLIALLIFIAQNSKPVTIRYLGFDGHISLAIALLLAAVGGILLVAIPGTARIIQLRRALKKNAAAPAKR